MRVLGVDEVGRGSWAGPLLVVVAQQKTNKYLPDGLADSKKLTTNHRQVLFYQIVDTCDLGEGWVQPEEIDEIGLTRAMKLATGRALMDIGAKINEKIIMDGVINYCPEEFRNVETIAKADSTHPIVSAASIYAKVKRDQHMSRLSQMYPNYHFDKHVGYGTKLHLEMIKLYGICQIHRKSYKPIKVFV